MQCTLDATNESPFKNSILKLMLNSIYLHLAPSTGLMLQSETYYNMQIISCDSR